MIKKRKSRTELLLILFAVYLIILFRITVFRSNFSPNQLFRNGVINLSLFKEYIPLLLQKRWGRFVYLFIGNIIWFTPLGVFLRFSKHAEHIRTPLMCGFLLSLLIETMQYIMGTGISELDDLILNTLGTWIGWKTAKYYDHFNRPAK